MKREFPILEFDAAPVAVIEPSRVVQPQDMPERCVLCFFQDVITDLCQSGRSRHLADCRSEMGLHPVYKLDVEGQRLAFMHPGVGAPLAAGLLEEVIALGCRKFIACGGAGVLDKDIAVGHLLVPTAAVRDEGTSYHYLPPARLVEADPSAVAAIEQVLRKHNINYLLTKTWTTDAFYRETPTKVQLRKSEGCLAVEMEAAAFFAVAQFRGVPFAQILYGGDDVSSVQWDTRQWHTHGSIRAGLFWLAVEACLLL